MSSKQTGEAMNEPRRAWDWSVTQVFKLAETGEISWREARARIAQLAQEQMADLFEDELQEDELEDPH